MRGVLLGALLLLFAAPAFADFPALYDVKGVTADDAVNIRASRSNSAAIIGTVTAVQKRIEVVRLSADGLWSLVNTEQRTGWVASRFLSLTPRAIHHDIDIYSCFGGKPSWTLTFGVGTHYGFPIGLSYQSEGQKKIRYWQDYLIYGLQKNGDFLATANAHEHSIITSWRRKRTAIAIVTHQTCIDETSGREFGLSVDIMRSESDIPHQESGCCSLGTIPPPAGSN